MLDGRRLRSTVRGAALCAVLAWLVGCAAPGGSDGAASPGSGGEPAASGDTDGEESVAEAIAAGDPSGYVLGNGDVIGIQVFDEPDLTLEARVGSGGVNSMGS